MDISTVIALIIALGAVYVVAPMVADAYHRFRGTKVVTCPEDQQAVEIIVDAAHAASTAALGPPELRVTHCSRWMQRHYCDQKCVEQLR